MKAPWSDMSPQRAARSEARRKLVVTGSELVRWLNDVRQEEQRLRQLENKQRDVFDGD